MPTRSKPFLCHYCKADTYVLETRGAERRRRCTGPVAHTIITVETYLRDPDPEMARPASGRKPTSTNASAVSRRVETRFPTREIKSKEITTLPPKPPHKPIRDPQPPGAAKRHKRVEEIKEERELKRQLKDY